MQFTLHGRLNRGLSLRKIVSKLRDHSTSSSASVFRCALVLGVCALYTPVVAANPLWRDCTSEYLNWKNKRTGSNSYRRSIDSRFNNVEQDLIERALQIAVKRLQQKRNWDRIQELYQYAWVTSNSLKSSGLCSEPDVRRNLLFHQLYWLSLPNGPNDTTSAFPDVYIRYAHEEPAEGDTGWVARARYDTVTIYWDGDGWSSTGDSKFVITLNNYYVAAHGVYSNAEYWAGTIAHEMLHNLGHRHPNSSDPNYEKYQINVVDEVIQNDGYVYKGSRRTLLSMHSCDG